MATQATKAWRGCLKIVYRAYSDSLCVEAADKTAIDGAACREQIIEVNPAMAGGLEAIYSFGNRTPTEILEGNIDLTIRIRRRFIDREFCHLAGIDSSFMLPGKVCIGIYPFGYVSTKPAIYMCGKFANWNLPLAQPDVEVEEVDFIGQCLATDLVT